MTFQPAMPPYQSTDPSATFAASSCMDFLLIEMVPLVQRLIVSRHNQQQSTLLLHNASGPGSASASSAVVGGSAGRPRPLSAIPSGPSLALSHGAATGMASGWGAAAGTGLGAAGGGSGGNLMSPSGSDGVMSATAMTTPDLFSLSATAAGDGGSVGGLGGTGRGGAGPGLVGTGSASGTAQILDEEEERDLMFGKLESLGYRVGQGMAERFSRDRPRFSDPLDMIKFLCKDLWVAVFRKQVDNLRTNHRGIYVLTDNSFKPLQRISTDPGGQALQRAQPFLWFPCGIIRGALSTMGIQATVHAESTELPCAVFQIKIAGAKD